MNYTVIVPFYNEEKNISSFNDGLINNIKKIENKDRKFEIVYVDDGSQDKTFEELKKLNGNACDTLVVKHSSNLSQSAALNTGISQSKNDNLIMEVYAKEISELRAKISSHIRAANVSYDIVSE